MSKDKWHNSIVIDLDFTICRPNLEEPDVEKRYGEAEPIDDVIEALRGWNEAGYYIIILTSRRMATSRGDVSAAEAEVGEITRRWLEEHEVPHDELVFGKPLSTTFYVDDRAMSPDDFVRHSPKRGGEAQ